MTDTISEYYRERMSEEKTTSNEVAAAFNIFIKTYDRFRKSNGLGDSANNPFELCAAIMDKTGRMARQVKHYQRSDPKKDWPDGLTEAMTGYLVYMLLILKHYDLDLTNGMVKELDSAVKQYGS